MLINIPAKLPRGGFTLVRERERHNDGYIRKRNDFGYSISVAVFLLFSFLAGGEGRYCPVEMADGCRTVSAGPSKPCCYRYIVRGRQELKGTTMKVRAKLFSFFFLFTVNLTFFPREGCVFNLFALTSDVLAPQFGLPGGRGGGNFSVAEGQTTRDANIATGRVLGG